MLPNPQKAAYTFIRPVILSVRPFVCLSVCLSVPYPLLTRKNATMQRSNLTL